MTLTLAAPARGLSPVRGQRGGTPSSEVNMTINKFERQVIRGIRIIIMLLYYKGETRERLVKEYLDETEEFIYK